MNPRPVGRGFFMMERVMVTMQDVAERAGVSKSTVSRVLSGKVVLSMDCA